MAATEAEAMAVSAAGAVCRYRRRGKGTGSSRERACSVIVPFRKGWDSWDSIRASASVPMPVASLSSHCVKHWDTLLWPSFAPPTSL